MTPRWRLFGMEAAGLVEAVLSAVADVERAAGVKVVRTADAGPASMTSLRALAGL